MPSGPGVIDDELARDIAASVPPPVATFLLTQRTSAADIADHVAFCGTDTVQIVNHIDPAQYPRLLQRLSPSTRTVQVVHVESGDALDLIEAYSPFVHAFLLDSGRPGADIPELGGTGRVHDWTISAEFVRRSPKPVFLAGGLNAENVHAAIREVRPYGLDLCTSVRTNDKLSPSKLECFMSGLMEAGRSGVSPTVTESRLSRSR